MLYIGDGNKVGALRCIFMSTWPVRGRKIRNIERRYVVEYVANKFKNAIWRGFNVRLGAPLKVMRKMYPELGTEWFKVWLPTADSVVITEDAIYIIEAKIRQPRAAVGQLLDYKLQLPKTPEFKRYLDRPIYCVLVVPYPDPMLRELCETHGIIMDVYRPNWVIDYMRERGLLPR